MTTILDIIDTTVKIGLGAAIAGITSYILTIRNQSYESKSNIRNEQRVLTKELSIRLERVESITNKVAYFYHSHDIESARRSIIPASEEIYIAVAESNLLGNSNLVESVQCMANSIDKLYRELIKASPKQSTLDGIANEFNANKNNAYPYLRDIYNKV